MNIHKTIYVVISIFFLNTCLRGQWTNDPAINTPVITEAKKQIYPHVLSDGEDGVYLSYLSGSDENEKIYVTRLDSNLTKLWSGSSIAVTTTFNRQFTNHPSGRCWWRCLILGGGKQHLWPTAGYFRK